MPICLVVTTEEARKAINRNVPVCLTTFPISKDFGMLPSQIPLVSVFNGDDHYCGTEPKKVSFKQGTCTFIFISIMENLGQS